MTEKINKEEVEILPLFSTLIVKINIGRNFTEDELQLCITDIPMRKVPPTQNHQSKEYYLFDSYVDILGDIKKWCEHHLKQYLEEVEGVDTDLAKLRITQSWVNKTKPGESHHLHHHPNSYLSGVLYINCLPNDGIVFTNRLYGMYNNMEFPKKKTTIWNTQQVTINVTEGDLIIFPSWMGHSVSRNKTKNRERISFSFNTFPIGEMGGYNTPQSLI